VTSLYQSGWSPEGDSSNIAANLYHPRLLQASARTTRPAPDTWTSLPWGPWPTSVTSTSMNSPGSIRLGAGKHTPFLLTFCASNGISPNSTLWVAAVNRRGKHAVNRGYRLRSDADVNCRPRRGAGSSYYKRIEVDDASKAFFWAGGP
jgi:hypothetical protein